MTPGIPMPVATTLAPTAAPPTTASASAPDSIAVDFMAMLGQMVGAAAPTSTAMQANAASGKALQELETTEPEATEPAPTDMLGLMPLSLPVMPTDVNTAGANSQATATAMLAVAAGLAKSQSAAVSPEAQLLTDLIHTEQPDTKFEIPQLPVGENTAALRQADTAHLRPVNVPVGNAAWADEIGARLTMMVDQGKHTASLRLSPEHLGPLEVRITMTEDKASVWFGAAHADTRAAIESALPRLREMFASQGLSLTDAGVSREPPRQQANQSPQPSVSSGDFSAETGDPSSGMRLGLLDAYA